MTIDEKFKNENLQYNINGEGAKISALPLGKIDKYEYLTGEETLPSDQRQIIEQAKFTYSHLGKTLEKQTKTIEEQGEKQIIAIENRVKEQLLDTDQNSIAILFSKYLFKWRIHRWINKNYKDRKGSQ